MRKEEQIRVSYTKGTNTFKKKKLKSLKKRFERDHIVSNRK